MKKFLALLLFLALFTAAAGAGEKIRCRIFQGKTGDWKIAVVFNAKGKMEIHTEKKFGQGSYSSLGHYRSNGKEVGYFYHSKYRSFKLNDQSITGTPFSFDIGKDYSKKIILRETLSYRKKCSKKQR